MRKLVKIEIFKLMNTVEKNNKILRTAIERNEYENTIDILTKSHEIIVDIATEIEYSEGERHYIYIKLEEYDNLLYKCSQIEEKQEKLNHLKQMIKLLTRIRKDIENDIPEQFVIVFLPYMASMWDSLESVWEAAKEDKDCVCFVVPIPYFDKKPDGELGTMHYEADQFPTYVPITDYKTFNLEKIYPEVIYIHNPYDEYNLITSVHPDYYSSNLKNYTNMLVYIPYFVSMDNMPEHFVNTSGVYNADKVILQSNEVKKIYIKAYKDAIIQNQEGNNSIFFQNIDKHVEEKFLSLGSPKFDKVISTLTQELDIPIKWKNKLFNFDGNKKKIILYNTTVASILTHREKMIDKIKSVIKNYKDNDNFILLWRPHPLTQSTLESMAPDLKEIYLSIVNEFIDDDIGIYDDSSDLHRAIYISDMYYGDKSSVVELYKLTNKPIMIQNVDYK